MRSYRTPTRLRLVYIMLASDEPSPSMHECLIPIFVVCAARLGTQDSVMQSVFDESRVQALEMIFVALLQATIIPNEVEPRHLLRVL